MKNLIRFCVILVAIILTGCSKPTSGTVKSKTHDIGGKWEKSWGSGPKSEGYFPDVFWIILENGSQIIVSSNEWNNIKIGDHWEKK